MTKHDRERCRQRRERQLDWELFDYELAHDLDREADYPAFHTAWYCFLFGPCSRRRRNRSTDEDE